MKRPLSAQAWIHWLEEGAGARWTGRGAVLLALLLLSLLVAFKQYHGPTSETTLVQADMGRQLALGRGFTTLVNYPRTAALMRDRHGVPISRAPDYPVLDQAPLYALVIAAALRALPSGWRAALFAPPVTVADAFRADFLLLGLNLALLWVAAWQTYRLGRRLFSARVGWVSMLALMLSVGVWQQVMPVDGLPLLMVLALAAFQMLTAVELALDEAGKPPTRVGRGTLPRFVALGAIGGLLFLAEYSAGLLAAVAVGYAGGRLRGGARWLAMAAVAAGFALVGAPWVARNLALTGSPVGLAWQNVALRAGDSTAEPSVQRARFTAEAPEFSLNKLGNKGLTGLQLNVQERLWTGGGYFLTAFFVAGLIYQFRRPAANRMRWTFCAALALLLGLQPFLNSGESPRLPAYYLLPPLLVFGTAFFFVLIESNPSVGRHPALAAAALLTVQAAPLVHDLLQPRQGYFFHYPPYLPALFMGVHADIEQRGGLPGMGVMADVPAGVAWYGRQRVWAQPNHIRDFYRIAVDQPIALLLLTPVTLDRPFFAQLAVAGVTPEAPAEKFQGWGPVYAGLVTGRWPPEFPLKSARALTPNLIVLSDPTVLPLR